MNRIPVARSLLWPMLVAMVTVALLTASAVIRRSPRALASSPVGREPAGDGVVCFGTVDLEHGVTSLFPLQPGRVSEVLVQENQTVAKGAELLRLDDAAARSRLAEAEAAVQLSRLQLRQAHKLPEQNRNRIEQQRAVLDAARSRLDATREVLSQKQKLSQPTILTALQISASEVQVREFEALERVEATRLAAYEAEDSDTEIRRAEYNLAVAQARRDQARLGLDECRLKAPRAGTVLRILVGPGDVLAAERAQPALLFAADGRQVIRATVEQEFAPRIKPGEHVVIQDEADGSVSWRGRVERVAGWYSPRRVVLHDPSQMNDVRTLECVIVLEPGQPRLRLGQGVRVFIGTVPR